MEFAGGHLFHKKPEDMRGVGALGGRTRARNLRLHKAREVPVTREISRPREETAGEAIRRIDALARTGHRRFGPLHGVLCLSPYPWDCCCTSISAQHDIAALGSQRSILLAIGVDSGGLRPRPHWIVQKQGGWKRGNGCRNVTGCFTCSRQM